MKKMVSFVLAISLMMNLIIVVHADHGTDFSTDQSVEGTVFSDSVVQFKADFEGNAVGAFVNNDPNGTWASAAKGGSGTQSTINVVQESNNKYLEMSFPDSKNSMTLKTPFVGNAETLNNFKIVKFRLSMPNASGIGTGQNDGMVRGVWRNTNEIGPLAFAAKDNYIVTNNNSRVIGYFNNNVWHDYVLLMQWSSPSTNTFKLTLYVDGVNVRVNNAQFTTPYEYSYSSNGFTAQPDTYVQFSFENYGGYAGTNAKFKLDNFEVLDPGRLAITQADLGAFKVRTKSIIVPFNNLLDVSKITANNISVEKTDGTTAAISSVEPYSTISGTSTSYINAVKINFDNNFDELSRYHIKFSQNFRDVLGTSLADGQDDATFTTNESTNLITITNAPNMVEIPSQGSAVYQMHAKVENKYFDDITASTPVEWKLTGENHGVSISPQGLITIPNTASEGDFNVAVFDPNNSEVDPATVTVTTKRAGGMKAWCFSGDGENPRNLTDDEEATYWKGKANSKLLVRLDTQPVSINKVKLFYHNYYDGILKISYSNSLDGAEPAASMPFDSLVSLHEPSVLFENAGTLNRVTQTIQAKYMLLEFSKEVELAKIACSDAPVNGLNIISSKIAMNIPFYGQERRTLSSRMKDTENEVVEGRNVTYRIDHDVEGVSLENGKDIVVTPSAEEGSRIQITASVDGTNVTASQTILLTKNIVNLLEDAFAWVSGSEYGNCALAFDHDASTVWDAGKRATATTVAVKLGEVGEPINKVVIDFDNSNVKSYEVRLSDYHPSSEPEINGGYAPTNYSYDISQRVVLNTQQPQTLRMTHTFTPTTARYLYATFTPLDATQNLRIRSIEAAYTKPYSIELAEERNEVFIPTSDEKVYTIPSAVVKDTAGDVIENADMKKVNWSFVSAPAGVTVDLQNKTIAVSSNASEGNVVINCSSAYSGTSYLVKSFSIAVKKLTGEALTVNTDYDNLTWESITNQPLNAVAKNLSLPTVGQHGSVITWQSDNEAVAPDGAVTNPASGKVPVKLTAAISKGSYTLTKEFHIEIIPQLTDSQILDYDTAYLTDAVIGNTSGVQKLNLITQAPYGSSVSWVSSNTAVVSPVTGAIQEVKYSNQALVTLTASIRYNGLQATKDFIVHVPYTNIKEEQGTSGGGGGGGGGSISVPLVPVEVPAGLAEPQNEMFSDIVGYEWAEEYFRILKERQIMSGAGENKVEPDRMVLREEFIKMVVLAFGLEYEGETPSVGFNDVGETDWYYSYVNTAAGLGIVNGVSSSEFGIGRSITREDMMTVLYRALEKSGMEVKAKKEKIVFTDEGEISGYAGKAIEALTMADIISGYPDNSFRPNAWADRASAAKVICRILEEKQ